MRQRLERLRQRLQEKELEALLVSRPENRRYLSGFTGSAGYLVISQDQAVLATDFRYVEQAGQQAPDFRVLRTGASLDWLPRLLGELKARRVGFEAQQVSVALYQQLTKAVRSMAPDERATLLATTGLVEELRAVKELQEVERLQQAVEVADRVVTEVAPAIQAGMTEREVAWMLERRMRELGAEAASFDIIVAAGPNAALPHHRPSDRAIAQGEPVVIDMGARYDGYCSDLTRTICLGQPDELYPRVYDTVLAAQLTAIATVEPGMTGGQADDLARRVIQEAGYSEQFGHGLGHGIGLAVHEQPRLGPEAQEVLAEGMVFTIEPGIYLPGWGGVRIEDVVLLEQGGARALSQAPK